MLDITYMNTYTIRDENGIAKAKVSNTIAHQIFNGVSGHFRDAFYERGKIIVFEIDKACTFYSGTGNNKIEILMWPKDLLVPDAS